MKFDFGIKREAVQAPGGHRWIITTTAPDWVPRKDGTPYPPSVIHLSNDQYERYLEWLEGDIMIQDALWEMSPAEREMLQTGISPKDWDDSFGDDD